MGIIKDGRLMALDTAEDLRSKHMRLYTVTLESPAAAKAFAADFKGRLIKEGGCAVEVAAKQSLEEIFLNYYGGERP